MTAPRGDLAAPTGRDDEPAPAPVANNVGEGCPRCGGDPRDVYGTSIVACSNCGQYLGQQGRPAASPGGQGEAT